MKTKFTTKFILFGILILAGIFRFYNLNWDSGHYLHPDERLYGNASNISFPDNLSNLFSPNSPLNPHMFYYGSFPLYVYKLANVFIFPFLSFDITGRFFSALLSTMSVYFIYLLGKIIFDKKLGIFAAFIFAFSAGSIQHAHFDTTESILVFFLALITFLSAGLIAKKNYFLLPLLGVLVGLSYATKIIGLTFALIPLIAIGYEFLLSKDKSKLLFYTFLFFLTALITGIITAPYQIIDYAQFKREQDYMQGVTYGKSKPPFAIIYEGSVAYIYPLIKALPFTFGFISLPLSILGFYFLIKEWPKENKKTFFLLLLTIYPIIYFLWAGSWYTKFSRYYILLFPFLALWAAYALTRFSKRVTAVVLAAIIINGLLFTKIYLFPHTRIQASAWVYRNVPRGAAIAGEHWDDNLPLPIIGIGDTSEYKILQLTVYDQDTTEKINQVCQKLSQSDYYIISSRRVYQSILNNKSQYPYTTRFYQRLFAGNLGFTLVNKFTNYPYFFSDDFADESFQTIDHPPVLIFKNTDHLSSLQIAQIIYEK